MCEGKLGSCTLLKMQGAMWTRLLAGLQWWLVTGTKKNQSLHREIAEIILVVYENKYVFHCVDDCSLTKWRLWSTGKITCGQE